MSLAGRILRRVTGQPDARPGYPTAYGDISIDKELPYLREQIRAYASVAPIRVTGPTWLDNFTGETFEMRRAYRNALLAEPSIKAALVGKIAAVQALGLQVKPYDDTPIDQTVADWVRHTINASQGGLPAVVDSILTPGLTDGFSVGEKVWRREDRGRWKGKVGLQKIKAKDSRYIQFEIDEFRNITGVIGMKGNAGERFDPGEFILFNHLSLFESPFGTSDLRASYRAASMIPALLRLRMIFLDKLTGPFIHAKVNDPALVESVKRELAQARQGGFIVTEPGDDIIVLDLAMKGTTEFLQALKDLREEVATGISGAFLTMMTSEGASGQRGNAQVQQDTVDLFIWLLAVKVAACINEQLVPDLVDTNFGSDVGLPIVTLEAPNPEHIVAELQIDLALDSLGVPLSLSEVYERAGRRPPKGIGDTITKPTGAPDPLGGPHGLPGAVPPGAPHAPHPGGPPQPPRPAKPPGANGKLNGKPAATFAEDSSGHEHKGKGPGGGQFTGSGGGGGKDKGGKSNKGGGGKDKSSAIAKGSMDEMRERIAKPDGGFTYQPVTHSEPKEGYALSIHPDRSVAVAAKDLKLDDLVDFAVKNADLFSDDGNFMGAWHDPVSDKVFLDVSRVTKDAAEAHELSLKHDQIAYFDLKEGKSVTVNAKATSGGAATSPKAAAGGDPAGVAKNYEADQPRDSGGRWATGGGSYTGSAAMNDYISWDGWPAEGAYDDNKGKDTPEAARLIAMMSQQPRFEGEAFRAVKMSTEELSQLTQAKKLAIRGVTSFSTNQDTAKEFHARHPTAYKGRTEKVILKAQLNDARDLQAANPDEREVVTRRSNFEITSVDKEGDITILSLKEKTA